MIVYSPTITNRLRYTCEFISSVLGTPIVLTEDRQIFREGLSPCINYSHEKLEAQDLWIKPHALLFQQDIRRQAVECFEERGLVKFFKTGGELSFDVFAAIFYLLSRYEEWLPHEKDIYGRYGHSNSLAWKENFLNRPLVNEWLEQLAQQLFINRENRANFRFIPTYDIDEAYSFLHKDWKRTAGAAVKDLLKGNWQRVKSRLNVKGAQQQDPFDSYDWMNALHQRYAVDPRYFFLLASKTGKYDRNISPAEPALQELVRQHAQQYKIGIHPSWQSGDEPDLLAVEISTLARITGQAVHRSRQHFIRLTLPGTYRRLIEAGIREEYSMGYGSINGFRASVASPFYWYDLEREEITSLRVFPFCYMEANSFYEQKQSPQEALNEMRHYAQAVKKVDGTLIMIWHNTFLGTDPVFAGWRDAYTQFISEICAAS